MTDESAPGTSSGIGDRRELSVRLLAVALLTVPAALVQGHLLSRWGPDAELQQRAAAVRQLPSELGDWQLVSAGNPLPSAVCQSLQLAGYVHRVYQHTGSGQRVAVLLLLGPGGPLVRHPPEICYGSLDNRLLATRELDLTLADQPQHFRLLRYSAEPDCSKEFCVAYAFGCHQRWDVPRLPRLAYAAEPALFKLQILTDVTGMGAAKIAVELEDFLRQLLPALNRIAASPRATQVKAEEVPMALKWCIQHRTSAIGGAEF